MAHRSLYSYRNLIVFLLIVICAPCDLALLAQGTETTVISPKVKEDFRAYLASHNVTPEDFVVRKFQDHDIVFLGEQHHIEQNLDFVQRLIPKLYAGGIYNLGFEFVNTEDQSALDRLLNSIEWDQAAAENILWRCYNLPWVSTGYIGILHAAWQVNHNLKSGAPRFIIVGVGIQSRPVSRSQLLPGEVPTDLEVHKRLLGLGSFDAINIHWAQVISEKFIAKHQKALIYGGAGHEWTRFFYQRRIEDNGLSAGNLIYDYIGDRVLRWGLNAVLQDDKDFDYALESLMEQAGVGPSHPAAFDIRGGPLGVVPVHVKGYLYGSDPSHQLVAGDVLDGCIFFASHNEWRKDKFVASFVTQQNFLRLRESWELYSRTGKANNVDELVRIIQNLPFP